ncbi:peptidoglycan-binding domain-containing protein [Streptomyces tsukubensis]|uniref:peptidoglycan-binding domain-containing protein n=1 Tax=Streptomyces tsukubensis TaxID=83656 RepID=UPI00117EEF94|nr:peptidoglycan-binding protein [Streptomyces tsukubensis]
MLRRGDKGEEVRELQRRLQQLRLFSGDADGLYDDRVESAVTAFQWSRGAKDERGVYGPDTREKLEGETQLT